MGGVVGSGPAEPLLPIGAFARSARLSPKALRLYDELGLLRPAFVDPLRGTGGPDQAVGQLIAAANAAGGPDNVSCVVADIVPLDAAAAAG
jgi:PPM family protein phosphatase